MRHADAPEGRHDEVTPLDVLPGIADIARIMADAITVTDVHRRVVVWNDAASKLYGIAAAEALGVPIEDLFDSTVVAGTSTAAARGMAIERGTWRGRVTDRPRLGRLVGHEIVIDAVMSRVDGRDGEAVGVLSVRRDMTDAVGLERELASLGSLTSATGETRSRETVAQRALEVIASTTRADHGGIVVAQGKAGRLLAGQDFPARLAGIVDVPWSDVPVIRAVAAPGRVVKGPVDRLPLTPATRRAFLETGIRSLLVVGLHREDELVGLLTIGWTDPDVPLPSDGATLLIAATVARSLENARLVEEVVRRADAERATTTRLRRLDELTRVGSHVQTLEELAERSGRLINAALGGAGAAYAILAADGESFATNRLVDLQPALTERLADDRPGLRPAIRRWRAGEGAFVESFAVGVIAPEIVEIAGEAGIVAYAGIPIRVGDAVGGGIAVYFDRPVAELDLDRGALERVATIASISLENFRLRDRLVDSERRYRTMFEESPDAILVTLTDGTIVDANDAAVRLFAAQREWLLGRHSGELTVADPGGADPVTAAARVGGSTTIRAVGIRRDGSHFPEEAVIASIELAGESRLLVRIHDLTDQERLQSELIQAQKMEATGQLVSGVAHELNNPLASILGFSQLIRRDPTLPDGLRHNADLLVEEATRTRRIVQNLLDFARQRPPERHPTSIRALVDSVLTLQSYSLGHGPISVEVDLPDDLPLVELDRGQIQQVLVNLTHNAIYAIRHGGGSRLGISARREGPPTDARVRITVMDDGSGVAPEDAGRVFEAFFTTKPPADGTGLGLPVSYGIVRSHGGELRYVPSAWGHGAAFTFDLPVRATSPEIVVAPPSAAPVGPAAPADQANDQAEPTGSHGRVLVLDDEPSIRTFLDQALRSLGYGAVVSATTDEAVERVGDGDLAALLVDHQLDGQSGIAAFERIAAARPDLTERFVMMSGDVLNPALEAFASEHRVRLLAKPFDLETLERVLLEVAPAAGQVRG